jgi:hypothetical protein
MVFTYARPFLDDSDAAGVREEMSRETRQAITHQVD